jgi:flagellar hook-associated protein 2
MSALDYGTDSGAERITNVSFGADNTLTFASAETMVDTNMTITANAGDASLDVDGITVTSKSNTVNEVLTGVTLDLQSAFSSGSVTVTIANDDTALEEKLQEFVDAYNGVVSYINDNRTGAFAGEASVRSIVSSLRNEINTETSGLTSDFSMLAEIGIQTSSDTGLLTINSSTLEDALSTDFKSVSDIFTKEPTDTSNPTDGGLAYRFEYLLDQMTTSSGSVIYGKMESLDSTISLYNDRLLREETRLEKVRERLTKKFAALEQMMSSMNSASQSLLSALG